MSLFKTTAELKQHITLDVNTKFGTMAPFITDAENQFIIPIIGQPLFDEINAQYNGAGLDANNTLLMPYIQKPLAYYAQLLSLNEIAVTVGDQGIRDNIQGDYSMPAPRWKQEKLELQILSKADRQADTLLEYLEGHATIAIYPLWFNNATLNTKMSGVIVYNTSIASRYIEINNSRRIFLRLKKYIKDIEGSIIKKLVGKAQYDLLVAHLKAGGVAVTANEASLIALLEPIVSKRALYIALPLMRVTIAGETGGLFLYSGTDELLKNLSKDVDIKAIQKQLREPDFGYESDEQELKQFINDNIANYPLIAASTAYTSKADPGPTYAPVNDPCNKHFSV